MLQSGIAGHATGDSVDAGHVLGDARIAGLHASAWPISAADSVRMLATILSLMAMVLVMLALLAMLRPPAGDVDIAGQRLGATSEGEPCGEATSRQGKGQRGSGRLQSLQATPLHGDYCACSACQFSIQTSAESPNPLTRKNA